MKLHKPLRSKKLPSSNTSGYLGVSWNKSAGKWSARIRVNGTYRSLGLFKNPEEASAAYNLIFEDINAGIEKANAAINVKEVLLDTVRQHYIAHGIEALSTSYLEKARLYARLLAVGLSQPVLLTELNLTNEYAAWRNSSRIYRGIAKPKWTYEVAIAKAKEIKEREGDLPTVEWFRKNHLNGVPQAVHASGRTWEDLREAVGCFATSNFVESRNGMRWRSRPEASLSNFLYARGIKHKRGERYASGYSEQSGRHHGTLDLHFVSATDAWIDVEIWGDQLNRLSGERYQKTKAFKERWQTSNPNFLGIPYQDCLSDAKLTDILKSYIGIIEPFLFDKPTDYLIETSHWTDADDLLDTCKKLAAQMPNGIFPSEGWLRKRKGGKYTDRPGDSYNTLAIYVNKWLGGVRNVRKLLGQNHASTTKWTPELLNAALEDFKKQHGLKPSQCRRSTKQYHFSQEIKGQASKLCEAARRLGVSIK